MSAASLVGALRQLTSRAPPLLAPKDFALLGALAQISLVRSKADEARRAGMLEAMIAFGAIFPVDAVAGLCTFLQEREYADAFCAQGGASVLLAAFERACQDTSYRGLVPSYQHWCTARILRLRCKPKGQWAASLPLA